MHRRVRKLYSRFGGREWLLARAANGLAAGTPVFCVDVVERGRQAAHWLIFKAGETTYEVQAEPSSLLVVGGADRLWSRLAQQLGAEHPELTAAEEVFSYERKWWVTTAPIALPVDQSSTWRSDTLPARSPVFVTKLGGFRTCLFVSRAGDFVVRRHPSTFLRAADDDTPQTEGALLQSTATSSDVPLNSVLASKKSMLAEYSRRLHSLARRVQRNPYLADRSDLWGTAPSNDTLALPDFLQKKAS